MISRRTKREIIQNPLELRNIFNIHYRFVEKYLINNSIKYLIMPPSFSGGFDFLIAIISKKLGIKTIFIESFHSRKFFYSTDWLDWGYFKQSKKLFNKIEVFIYEKDPTKLFYINQYEKTYKKSKGLKYKILFYIQTINLIVSTFIFSFFSKKILMKSFFEISGKLFSKASKVKFFLNQSNNINYALKNLNLDYVYFPLSYQPEATTLSYGDEYDDQLLAIEKIDKIIPKNWKILVKEHNSKLPKTLEEVKKLPGVGEYTANALLGLVYNQPRIAIDGNVKRIFARNLNKKEKKINFDRLIIVNKKNFFNTNRSSDFLEALMEFGALICKPKEPKCFNCCLNRTCKYFKSSNKIKTTSKKLMKNKNYDIFCYINKN